jgi:hypothetical protein
MTASFGRIIQNSVMPPARGAQRFAIGPRIGNHFGHEDGQHCLFGSQYYSCAVAEHWP